MWIQLGIALTGIAAVWLSQDPNPSRQRYACLFGLAGQPFWFLSAWEAQQWGVFLLCCAYAVAWAKGFHTYWIKPRRAVSADHKKPKQSLG